MSVRWPRSVCESITHSRFIAAVVLALAACAVSAGDAANARRVGAWQVERGETLYSIARALEPGNRVAQARLRRQLLRDNPQAFSGGDPARLIAGARLQVASGSAPKSVVKPEPAKAAPAPAAAPSQPEPEPIPKTAVERAMQRVATGVAAGAATSARRQAPGPRAATAIAVAGTVEAIAADGTRWRLSRGGAVYSGDRVVTGAGAQSQLRFTDGGVVALRSSSEFSIDEYRFSGEADGSESGFFRLLRGGLRTLTGLIGKKRHDRYRMTTPIATIGIRGTDYSLFLCTSGACAGAGDNGGALPEGLYGAVIQGAITSTNQAGEFALGTGQFFRVPDPVSAPVPVLAPPEVLLRPVAARRRARQQQQAAAEKRKEGRAQGAAATGGEQSSTQEGGGRSAGDGVVEPGTAVPREGGEVAPLRTTLGAPRTTVRELVDARSLPSAVLVDDSTGLAPAVVSGNQVSSSGVTLQASTQLVRAPVGSAVTIGFVDDQGGSAGRVIDKGGIDRIYLGTVGGAANIPKAVEATDVGTDPCNGTCVFASGSGVLTDVGGAGGPGLGINWGRWRGDFYVADGSGRASTTGGLGFMYSPNLTTRAQLGALSGIGTFSNLLGGTAPVDEHGNVYAISTHSVVVDFNAQQVNSYSLGLSPLTGGRIWNAGLVGGAVSIDQAIGKGVKLGGTCSGCALVTTPVSGEATLTFVGPNAERVMSGFQLGNVLPGASGPAVAGTMALER